MNKDYTGFSDKELLKMFHDGDEIVFNEITNRYKSMVKLRAREFFLIGGDSQDLIQEGTIGLLEAVVAFREDRNAEFSTFANICVRRRMMKAVDSDNTKKNLPLNSSISLELNEDADKSDNNGLDLNAHNDYGYFKDPEEIFFGKVELDSFMEDLTNMLSKMEKEVLHLFLEGKTYKEISVILGKSEKSIDNCINRILNKASKLQLTNDN